VIHVYAIDVSDEISKQIPVFGYKSHVSIDRPHGVIRRGKTTDSAAQEGARLREGLIDIANIASEVWVDGAYRSSANERFLDKAGKVSRIHHKKPRGQTNATRRRPGQCGQIKDPRPRRACLCRTEGPDGPVHSHHRHRPCRSRDHAG
jgi:transposase, IS5 family